MKQMEKVYGRLKIYHQYASSKHCSNAQQNINYAQPKDGGATEGIFPTATSDRLYRYRASLGPLS